MQKQEIKPMSVVLSDRIISKDISTFLKDISFHKRSARLFRTKADSFNLFYFGLQTYVQELESSNVGELVNENEMKDMCCGVQLIGKEIEDFCRSHIEYYDLIPENFKKGEVDICKIEIPETKDSPAKSRILSGELVSATYESISCLQEFILNYIDLLFLLYNRAGDQNKEYKVQSELLEAKKNLTLLFNKYKEIIENINKKKMIRYPSVI